MLKSVKNWFNPSGYLLLFYFFAFYVKNSFIAKELGKLKRRKSQPLTKKKASSDSVFEA